MFASCILHIFFLVCFFMVPSTVSCTLAQRELLLQVCMVVILSHASLSTVIHLVAIVHSARKWHCHFTSTFFLCICFCAMWSNFCMSVMNEEHAWHKSMLFQQQTFGQCCVRLSTAASTCCSLVHWDPGVINLWYNNKVIDLLYDKKWN